MDKNNFTKRPPMGWNSYDYYDTTVTEAQVKENKEDLGQGRVNPLSMGHSNGRMLFVYMPLHLEE